MIATRRPASRWLILGVVGAVGILGISISLAVSGDGGSGESLKSPSAAVAGPVDGEVVTEAPAVVSAEVSDQVQQLLAGITSQLGQAVYGSGGPQALTPEQVEALLRIELDKLGIK